MKPGHTIIHLMANEKSQRALYLDTILQNGTTKYLVSGIESETIMIIDPADIYTIEL